MSLDLRNFVNIHINYHQPYQSTTERGIVTLITTNTNYAADPLKDYILTSFEDYQTVKSHYIAIREDTSLDIYAETFFANGGKKLSIRGGYDGTGSEWVFRLNLVKSLEAQRVIVAFDCEYWDWFYYTGTSTIPLVPNLESNTPSTDGKTGISEKIFAFSTRDLSGKLYDPLRQGAPNTYVKNKYYELDESTGQFSLLTSDTAPEDWGTWGLGYYRLSNVNADSLNNCIMKVGPKGIEMAAAAYLSQIEPGRPSSVQDYAFTIEDLSMFTASQLPVIDNSTGVTLARNHFNFDTDLVNATRNFPGDALSGADIVNYYMKILLTQDLTDRLAALLVSKIKFNQSGINRVMNVISQTMNTYIDNGYLNTDFIWTGEDITYTFNGREYLVCSKNTPFAKGYKCIVLPLASLTDEQRERHAMPPIYMVLADQTGIRSILINGDVY